MPTSCGSSASRVLPLPWAMKKGVIYAVNTPSPFCLPCLAVTLAADGAAKASSPRFARADLPAGSRPSWKASSASPGLRVASAPLASGVFEEEMRLSQAPQVRSSEAQGKRDRRAQTPGQRRRLSNDDADEADGHHSDQREREAKREGAHTQPYDGAPQKRAATP